MAMRSSIRNKLEGALHEVKGTAKEIVGTLCNNRQLEAEGMVEKVAGKAQGRISVNEPVVRT